MRHKQSPVKSSRHKSVTFIIDSHTSFGDHNESNSFISTGQQNVGHHKHHRATQPILADNSTRPQRPTNYGGSNTSGARQSSSGLYGSQTNQMAIVTQRHDGASTLTRKQFEHNFGHMSDVMRMAFLENNDIFIEDYSNIDFNSLSTASILQRNIQQQLQLERRDQLHMRQQLQQQQNQHHMQKTHLQPQLHHQFLDGHQLYDEDLLDDYEINDEYDDVSDGRIFATTTLTNDISVKNSHRRATQQPVAANAKRRTKETTPRVAISSPVKQKLSILDYRGGFYCEEPGCGKSFPSSRKLRHHKVVHSDDFPFVCEFQGCSKKFKRKFGIDLHSTTHFDLDPAMYNKTSNNSSLPFFGRRIQYSTCKPCGQKFKTVHEYQYHMLEHGKEPFKCPVKGCGQTFSIWKSFQKHRASHYFNYYCNFEPKCGHHTSNLQLLKLHIYCCHFRRKLPENASLMSKDLEDEQLVDEPLKIDNHKKETLKEEEEEESMSIEDDSKISSISTPRRDPRLRKNPLRSSAFGVNSKTGLSSRNNKT